MRAVICWEYGGADALRIEEIPAPSVAGDQVLVDIHVAAVNYPDLLMISNGYQVSVPLPFVPGSEFAGVVSAVGPEARGLAAGDRVSGVVPVGAFAEQVAVASEAVTKIPEGVGLRQAAAFGVAYRTAYHALRSVAEVRQGEWMLVLGAAGGVGLAAVDVARVLGARVIAAASGEEKLALCRRRGADVSVDYERGDLRAAIREVREAGVDVVVDPVGGARSEAALRGMARGGRFVTLGYASGEIPRIPLNLVLLKGVTIHGMELRTFGRDAPEKERRDREELIGLLAGGRLSPHIGATFPFSEARSALTLVGRRRALGKVLIEIVPAAGSREGLDKDFRIK